jgi:hypothetical protein
MEHETSMENGGDTELERRIFEEEKDSPKAYAEVLLAW